MNEIKQIQFTGEENRGSCYRVCPDHGTLYRSIGGTTYFRREPRSEVRRVNHKPSAEKLNPRRPSHFRQIKRTIARSGFIQANNL